MPARSGWAMGGRIARVPSVRSDRALRLAHPRRRHLVRSPLGEELRREALSLRDPLDLDRHRLDDLLDSLDPLAVAAGQRGAAEPPERIRREANVLECRRRRQVAAPREQGGDVRLLRVPERILKIVELLGFTKVLQIYDTEQSALDGFARR